MSATARFSLWLLLPRQAHERFQALIARLSVRLGTPAFGPHVTLLGSVAEHVLRAILGAVTGNLRLAARRASQAGQGFAWLRMATGFA